MGPTASHLSEPEHLNAAVAEAFRSGDLDAFVALHTPDATVLVPPEGNVVQGVDAIRETAAPMLAMKPEMTSTVIKVIESDGVALTHARWVLSATAPDGQPIEMRGRGTIVSRRQGDGTWRIAIDDPLTPG